MNKTEELKFCLKNRMAILNVHMCTVTQTVRVEGNTTSNQKRTLTASSRLKVKPS